MYPPDACRAVGGAARRLFLVEADGAARKPLKAPAAHEPVLPEPLDCCVAGGRSGQRGAAVGRPGTCTVPHWFAPAAGQEPGESGDARDAARLVEHPEGLFRNCPAGCRRLVFANKGDGPGALVPLPKPPPCPVPWRGLQGSAAQGWCVPLTAGAQRTLGWEALP